MADPQTTSGDPQLRAIIANVMLWVPGTYDSPEDAADALLRRLDHEGYQIVARDGPKP